MAVCQHRPDPGGALTPCASYVDGKQRTCICSAEVKAELLLDEERAPLPETRVARVPDSARPIELGESA